MFSILNYEFLDLTVFLLGFGNGLIHCLFSYVTTALKLKLFRTQMASKELFKFELLRFDCISKKEDLIAYIFSCGHKYVKSMLEHSLQEQCHVEADKMLRACYNTACRNCHVEADNMSGACHNIACRNSVSPCWANDAIELALFLTLVNATSQI